MTPSTPKKPEEIAEELATEIVMDKTHPIIFQKSRIKKRILGVLRAERVAGGSKDKPELFICTHVSNCPICKMANKAVSEELERLQEENSKKIHPDFYKETVQRHAKEIESLKSQPDASGLVEALKELADFSPHCCEDCPCDYFRQRATEALRRFQERKG